jgi:hypothetical protein
MTDDDCQKVKKQKLEMISKTIGLMSVPDLDNYDIEDYKKPRIVHKILKIDNLTIKDWSCIIACCSKPFAFTEKMRGGGTRSGIATLVNDKYGVDIKWDQDIFVINSSDTEEDEEEDDDDDKNLYNDPKIHNIKYDPIKSHQMIRDTMKKCDMILEGYYINDESDFDYYSIISHWKFVLKGEEIVDNWFNTFVTKPIMRYLTEPKKKLRDDLFVKYPFLEANLLTINKDSDLFDYMFL